MIVFAILMAIGVPIAVAMMFGSIIAVVLSDKFTLVSVIHRMVAGVDSYILLAIPFFILAGNLMNTGGVTKKLFRFASVLVGHIPGGLAHSNVVASIIFAGMSGSAVADAGGLGQVEIQAMREEGFDDEFSAAVTSASSTIGPIIPPSIPMVIYGAMAEVSVGALFMAGFIPGIVMGLLTMVIIFFIAKKRNYPVQPKPTLKVVFESFKESFLPLMTPVIIIGGMWTGIFTPTEAAVVASIYSLILATLVYKELSMKDLFKVFIDSAVSTATIIFIIMAATAFSWVTAMEGIPQALVSGLLSITNNPYVIILLLNIAFLIVGMFMESNAALTISVPFLMPLISIMGFDPVHVGLFVILNLMIGLVTPPVGMCLFVTAKVAKVKLEALYREILPFLVPLLAVLFLISYFPEIVLFLPRVVMGYGI